MNKRKSILTIILCILCSILFLTGCKENECSKPEYSLKDIYAAHDIKAGTCISPEMISNPETERIIKEQFNSVTMENAMKPDYILDKEESIKSGDVVVKFNDDLIGLLDFAKENGMSVRGHTLIWYSQSPDWIFHEDFNENSPLVLREVMLVRMESYIRQVFETLEEKDYADMFYAYDVVNEAIMDDGKLRDNTWREIIGDDYLNYAFIYADKYAPDSIDLYYNDYNEQYKAGAMARIIGSIQDDTGRCLVDGIGLQAHLYTGDNLFNYFKAVDKLSSLGLKIEITELDVSLGTWDNALAADEKTLSDQRQFYYELLNGLVEKKDEGKLNIDAITFWGFADDLSWRKDAKPLLFDSNLNEKESFYGAALLPMEK